MLLALEEILQLFKNLSTVYSLLLSTVTCVRDTAYVLHDSFIKISPTIYFYYCESPIYKYI